MVFRAVLVATDLTPQSEPALRMAAALARNTGAALVAIYVVPLPQRLMQWSAPPARSESKAYRSLLGARMDAARAEIERQVIRMWGSGHDGECVVAAGGPAQTDKGGSNMSTAIVFRNIEITPAQRRSVEKYSEHLEQYFAHVIGIEWHISKEDPEYVAACHLQARSGHYHSEARSPKLAQAIRLAAEQVEKQRRRRKKMQIKNRRRSGGRMELNAIP